MYKEKKNLFCSHYKFKKFMLCTLNFGWSLQRSRSITTILWNIIILFSVDTRFNLLRRASQLEYQKDNKWESSIILKAITLYHYLVFQDTHQETPVHFLIWICEAPAASPCLMYQKFLTLHYLEAFQNSNLMILVASQ